MLRADSLAGQPVIRKALFQTCCKTIFRRKYEGLQENFSKEAAEGTG